MMAVGKRHIIKGGHQFDRFFTSPEGKTITVKKEARLKDTIKWMKKVISGTLPQTEMIAKRLQGAREILTCERIWRFCFEYFQYERDEERTEQLRTPNRAWGDRKAGVDCDCFTILIGSILTNLGIPYVMRITRYKKDKDFEHVYPVALTSEGEVIIDAVVHRFNYQVPYIEKEDFEMELQVLSGVTQERYNELGDKVTFEHELPIDAEDLFLDESALELQGLEGKAEREARKKKRKAKRTNLPIKERLKKGLKKGFNVINKANPAALLLRAGVLAGLKLNVFKVASHIRFAYWTEDEARKNEMDLSKFHQLQRIRQKMEKIYFGAGGKVGALKKAILGGKGNRNKMVGLDGLGAIIPAVSDQDELRTVLGEDLFYEELNGLDGLGGFGAIATGTAITAASGIMGTIAALIKKLGGLFKEGSQAAENFKIQDNTDNEDEKTRKFSLKNIFKSVAGKIEARKQGNASESLVDDVMSDMDIDPEDEFMIDQTKSAISEGADAAVETPTKEEDDENKGGALQWIKDNPGKTALIGVGTVAAVGTTIYLVKKNKEKKGKPKKEKAALAGVPKTSKKKKTPKKKTKNGAKRRPTKGRSTKRTATTNNKSIPKVELL